MLEQDTYTKHHFGNKIKMKLEPSGLGYDNDTFRCWLREKDAITDGADEEKIPITQYHCQYAKV